MTLDAPLVRGACPDDWPDACAGPTTSGQPSVQRPISVTTKLGGRSRVVKRAFKRLRSSPLPSVTRSANDLIDAFIDKGSASSSTPSPPTDDSLSALLAESADGDKPLTMHELQNLMNQPITGGYTTTADSIDNAMLLLLDHPDHMERPRPVRCSRAACTFVSDSNWPSGK